METNKIPTTDDGTKSPMMVRKVRGTNSTKIQRWYEKSMVRKVRHSIIALDFVNFGGFRYLDPPEWRRPTALWGEGKGKEGRRERIELNGGKN